MPNTGIVHFTHVTFTMTDTNMTAADHADDVLNRNLLSRVGKYALATSAGIAGIVGVSVAPRTTLGVAALGAGLVAAGNRDRLIDWGKSFKKDTPDSAPATAEAQASA